MLNFGRTALRRELGPGRLIGAAAAALTWAGLAAAAAVPVTGYPVSGRADDVLAWTAASTSIPRSSIVIMTPEMVVALMRAERRPDGTVEAAVREEVIDPQLAARMGARSLTSEVAFDCAGRRRRFLGDVAYSEADLKGVPRRIQEPSGWAPTRDGTITAQVEAGVCAPDRVPPAQWREPTRGPAASQTAVYVVRVGTFASESNAQGAAAALRDVLPAGGEAQKVVVRPAVQGARRYFVVEAQGFAERAQAAAFCRSASSRLPDCVVLAERPSAGEGG